MAMPRRQRSTPGQPVTDATRSVPTIVQNDEVNYDNISADHGGIIRLNNTNDTYISADGNPLRVTQNRKETYQNIRASNGASVSIGNHFNHVNNHTVSNTGHGGSGINTNYYHGTSASRGQKPRTSFWNRFFCGGSSSDSDYVVAEVSSAYTQHSARPTPQRRPAPGLRRNRRNGPRETPASTGVWPLDPNAPSVFDSDSGVWPFDQGARPTFHPSYEATNVNTGALGTSSYGVHQSSKCTQTIGRSKHDYRIDVGNLRFGPGSKPSFEVEDGRVTKIGPSRVGDAVCIGEVAPANGMREASGPLLSIFADSRPDTSTNANWATAKAPQTRTRQRGNRVEVK